MKRFFPYIPLFVLLFGVTIIQIGSSNHSGIMSSTLVGSEEITEGEYCTKPETFVTQGEKAWCQDGTNQNIQKHKNTWNWECKTGEVVRECTFTETKNYPVRGGTYFSQK